MTVVFSPVRQHPAVLDLFLDAILTQDADIWVYDDNDHPESSELLNAAGVRILDPIPLPAAPYQRTESTHQWTSSTIRRVAAIKNYAIDAFLETGFDRLLLVDSDVLLPTGGLDHLEEADLPVLAAVYWTRWYPDMAPSPNLFPITSSLLSDVRNPGHWQVDGLGACTLIRREVLEQVRFDPVAHLATEGEDRWFCWRCHQVNVPLTVCTHIEPFHVYRDTDVDEARRWLDADRAAQLV